MAEKTDQFAGLVRRLGWWMVPVAVIGVVVCVVRFDAASAAGFAVGSVGAYCNMRWLARSLVAPQSAGVPFMAFRYILLAGGVYAMLKLFGIHPLAVLAGLLTATFAAVLEILYQVLYART